MQLLTINHSSKVEKCCNFVAEMKLLKRFVNGTIWSILTLYLLLMLLVRLPPVQHWIGSAVAGIISDKLNTEVYVGRVDLGFLNRLIIDDVTILDQRSVEMLYARRLSVRMDIMSLLDGSVNISSAQLFGTHVNLYRDSLNAEPNYQFVIDALSSNDNDSPATLDLHIGSLIVRRLSVNYDQLDAPTISDHLDSHHLHINDISAHVLLRTFTPDSLCLYVRRLSGREHSGIDIRQLAFNLEANKTHALLSRFIVELPYSTLNIDSLNTSYQLDSLPSSLEYRINACEGNVSLADLHSIIPDSLPLHYAFKINTTKTKGTLSAIYTEGIYIQSVDNAFSFQGSGHYTADDAFIHVNELHLSEQFIADMHKTFPIVPDVFTRIGNVNLTADLTGDENISGDCTCNTSIGTLSLSGAWSVTDHRQWNAHVETDSLDLCRLLDSPDAGLIAAHLDILAAPDAVSIKGDIPRVDWQGYHYRELNIDGIYQIGSVSGHLTIDDPNLMADVEGVLSLPSQQGSATVQGSQVRLTGYVGTISPKALHLSDDWGDASFSAIIDADVSASSLSDVQGTIDLDDFIMLEGDSTLYHLDNLHIRSGYNEEQHYLRLGSDFGEAQLKGRFDLASLPLSFRNMLPLTDFYPPSTTGYNDVTPDNNFNLYLRLTDSQWMQQLLGVPLQLHDALSLNAHVNDAERLIDMTASIPAFNYAGQDISSASFQLNTYGDSAVCRLTALRVLGNGQPQLIYADAEADGHQLQSALTIENSLTERGTINTITRFYTNDQGGRETHIRVLPSQFLVNGATWQLEPSDIVYSEKRLMVDHFTLHHADEHLIVDGIASTHAADSLMLDMQGIDVDYLLNLVNFHSVKFGGHASGRAYVCHSFNHPEAWADIIVGDFLFQDAPMGVLEAHAEWSEESGQIDLDAAIDAGADAQTVIDGFISPVRKELDLGILARGTSIGFLHSFTSSFLSRVEGQAWGDVRVYGPLKNIDLSGEASVTGTASVIPLGTTYALQADTVRLSEGTIAVSNLQAFDRDGHQALLSGALHHRNLKNFTFDVIGHTEGLLAYDFPRPSYGTGVVGGTVWADGTVVMRGRPGIVTIDCDLTPTPGSIFYYNTANPDAINQQRFISWGTAPTASEEASTIQMPEAKSIVAPSRAEGMAAANVSSDLRMNLRINATPQATLYLLMDQNSDDHIALHGSGALRASYYNKGAFQLFGTYDVEHGTYSMTIQNLLKKNFQFQTGSSIIFGGDPLQAALNLKAQHTVSGVSLSDLGLGNSFTSNSIRVNCLMNIGGTAGEPRVEFDLEMPTVNSEEEQMIRSIIASEQEINQQVVYLLGIGRFYTQGANNAATQTYGQTELAMQSLLSGTVSSQINTLLSQVIKNDDWNFGANISTGNEGWHNAEYEGTVSGRMLNNRLLVNGQFGYRDNATQATPSFIGDFDIRYLLTPGGSIALKAYNQTNDRYFTHSSLNTQGIGIILKKDFNGLRDLFSHQKRRKR